MRYRLSLLDQSPIAEGSDARQALKTSLALALQAEQLGYHRYWLAEHHGSPTLASPAPEVLAAFILARTQRIRVGSGGVLLRHYAPYKVAEIFRQLATLAPGRVDLGIGKAPGGLPVVSRALAQGQPETQSFGNKLAELEGFLSASLPADHPFAEAVPLPHPAQPPERFLLGSSVESAQLAAQLGWQFVYAGHFDGDPARIERSFHAYRQASALPPLLSVAVLAAPSAEVARQQTSHHTIYRLHLSDGQSVNLTSIEAAEVYVRQAQARDYRIESRHPEVLAGDPEQVRAGLDELSHRFGIEEFILHIPTAEAELRRQSLELLAPALRAAA